MRKLISYKLSPTAPGWPGNPKLEVLPFTQISAGEDANTFNLRLFNHYGSHMDGARHFNDKGPRLAEEQVDAFFFEQPLLIDLPKESTELIVPEDLEPYTKRLSVCDLLLCRSGFSKYRKDHPENYSAKGPGFSSEVCRYLMDHFPNIRGLAMDWISLASYAHGEDGVLAHQYILGMFHSHHKLIIEDLNLAGLDPDKLRRVTALPLLIEGVDSGPCTVVAELDD